ncbi:MAG: septal ring lytic transglycosylase RlpA family protein [Smithella sp.]
MSLANFKGKLMFIIFISQFFLLVVALPLNAEDAVPVKEKTSESEQKKMSSAEEETAGILGVARYYAKRYKGRRTSSGAIYDPQKLTAAHPSIPLGARVKVINLANNLSVIVIVNDRCRKYKTPYIDLSRMAASQLGFLGRYKARVKIIPLKQAIKPSPTELSLDIIDKK